MRSDKISGAFSEFIAVYVESKSCRLSVQILKSTITEPARTLSTLHRAFFGASFNAFTQTCSFSPAVNDSTVTFEYLMLKMIDDLFRILRGIFVGENNVARSADSTK